MNCPLLIFHPTLQASGTYTVQCLGGTIVHKLATEKGVVVTQSKLPDRLLRLHNVVCGQELAIAS